MTENIIDKIRQHLDNGRLREARWEMRLDILKTGGTVPAEMVHELLVMEEIDYLGASFYPYHVPVKDRWHSPRVLNTEHLLSWWVAKIDINGHGEVQLTIASPEKRIFCVTDQNTIENARSQGIAIPKNEDECTYVEIGMYTNMQVLFKQVN